MKNIQAQDIRIGNLIQWQDDSFEIVQVTGIYLDKEMSNKTYYAVDFIDPYGNKENDGSCFIDEFIGIKLTKQWLLNFGFKPFCKDFAIKNLIIHTRKRGFVVNKKIPVLEYVHDLQNLYYAHIKTELKLKKA